MLKCPTYPILPHEVSLFSPIRLDCNMLFKVTFGYIDSIKNLLALKIPLKHFRTPFLSLLKRVLNTNQKRFFIEQKKCSTSHFSLF